MLLDLAAHVSAPSIATSYWSTIGPPEMANPAALKAVLAARDAPPPLGDIDNR